MSIIWSHKNVYCLRHFLLRGGYDHDLCQVRLLCAIGTVLFCRLSGLTWVVWGYIEVYGKC